MNELRAIVEACRSRSGAPDDAILATVVDVKGSAYRKPGARMLITPDGNRVGSVSGGCLEGEIIKKGWWWTESGEPTVRVYDTTADPDTVWELGLGCNGEVRVLLERVGHTETSRQMISFLGDCVGKRISGVLATVIAAPEQSGVSVGARLFLNGETAARGPLLETDIGSAILACAHGALASRKSGIVSVPTAGGAVEVTVEVILPALPVVIFGAGYDALPLVRVAKELGWHVTVADGRPSYAVEHRFPSADEVVLTEPGYLLKGVRLDSRTAAVIMNHSYWTDREILRELLPQRVGYIGMLGPKARTEKILSELGVAQLPETLHAPIGLDIGADTPEGIGLAIAAEIQAVTAGREGGKLRRRSAPVYGRDAEVVPAAKE